MKVFVGSCIIEGRRKGGWRGAGAAARHVPDALPVCVRPRGTSLPFHPLAIQFLK